MNEITDTRSMTKQIEFTGRLLDYKEFLQYSKRFIECGVAAGDGIQRALDAGFESVTGIEASKMYYEMSRNRFVENGSVSMILGKSVDNIGYVTKYPKTQVIYLDAHVSGDTSFGFEEWVKDGENGPTSQDNIIKAELAIILANSNKHVIIIDDVNGLTDGHAIEYMDIMLKANPEYKFQFYDENLSKDPTFYYKDKILVAIP